MATRAARSPKDTSSSGGATAHGGAYLVRGDDPSLVGQAVHDLLGVLVGARDATTVVEEHGGPAAPDLDVGLIVDAVTTPPFITDRRVVVVREAGRLVAADAGRLVACLEDPVPGVVLVLVAGGGTIPAALVKAVDRQGSVIDAAVGTGRARTQWLVERLHAAPVRLDARAATLLGDHLGGDLSRVQGLLDTLEAAYGPGSAIDSEKLEPFLGEAGRVAPWDLTDAIDAGDTATALAALGRLTGAGGSHPLVILSVLHRHYQAMLRLDGAGVTSGEQAATLLGMRSAFPARKALEQGRRMGPARLGRAITLLAEADLDVRGRRALPDGTILEVLVGRLSRLGSVREAAAGRGGRSPARRRPS
ncbi:MAG TPA: DNA polymerase III subunit delta [Acidimicrobiales bacterium]|nr:DNA polymerase III subunit delta [Acidimicrobiales bacterium]